MTAAGGESVPTTWSDDRDGTFFRITASLFPTPFTYGAGVLLASYDDDCDASAPAQCAIAATVTNDVAEGANASGARSQ